MICRIHAATTLGLDGVHILVEVDVAERGFPTFTIVGLPSKAIEESKERVRTAIKNTSLAMPETRIVVNLAPADVPKSGSLFDLPIAVGILVSSQVIAQTYLESTLFIGELSLDGRVCPVNGVLPIVLMARDSGYKNVVIPFDNCEEASIISGITIYPVKKLSDLLLHLNDEVLLVPAKEKQMKAERNKSTEYDFAYIKGQMQAKRALEIVASGFHNLHFTGPPGAGKTLLARSLCSILPPLDKTEMIEVAKIYSIYQGSQKKLVTTRPFRSPHHTISRTGLIGGGNHLSPGEISLAHRGVLFLDELPEFPRYVLEALRQPLEDGCVSIARAQGSVLFPSRFILVSSANPCHCGYLGHPKKACTCSIYQIDRYKKRISGPLLDRIDLHLTVKPVEREYLIDKGISESSNEIVKRVETAWHIQQKRFSKVAICFNGEMNSQQVREFCVLSPEAQQLMAKAASHLTLSARSYFKIIKIAQTIADLSKKESIEIECVAEALQYRNPE